MSENICAWALRTPLERVYHDEEWGLPLRDDQRLFQLPVLEYMQAGLVNDHVMSCPGYLKARDGLA